MSEHNYKKHYSQKVGYTVLSDPSESDLKLLTFGMIELFEDDSVEFKTEEKEYAFIILGGRCSVRYSEINKSEIVWDVVGARRSIFEGKPVTFYFGRNTNAVITGLEHVKIAVCGCPVDKDSEAEVIGSERAICGTRGVKPWERENYFLVGAHTNAIRLTAGETFITPGNWAGFPPHKHDTLNMPEEAVLDEIYYFLFHPRQGFAIQKLYTKDKEIDETYTVEEDDFIEFPKGYHTTVGAPGYQTYFLWMMAGSAQGFYRANDPAHDWVTAVENVIKRNM